MIITKKKKNFRPDENRVGEGVTNGFAEKSGSLPSAEGGGGALVVATATVVAVRRGSSLQYTRTHTHTQTYIH